MKKCPYCAEEIQDEAVKCRFCGEFLKKEKKWLNCLWGCLIAFFLLSGGFIFFLYFVFLLIKIILHKIFFVGPGLPDYPLPFTGQGIDGIVRGFADLLRLLWERFLNFWHGNPGHYQAMLF
jgi:hypothetical protein